MRVCARTPGGHATQAHGEVVDAQRARAPKVEEAEKGVGLGGRPKRGEAHDGTEDFQRGHKAVVVRVEEVGEEWHGYRGRQPAGKSTAV